MTVSIRAGGGWPDGTAAAVEGFARQVLDVLAPLTPRRQIGIVVMNRESGGPMTANQPLPTGEYLVFLQVGATVWNQLAYQLAHEYGHVVANGWSWRVTPLEWIEEVICEAAALFALRRLSATWAASPNPIARGYAPLFASYAAGEMRELPAGTTYEQWLHAHVHLLETTRATERRAEYAVIAPRLLPFFEQNEQAWEIVQDLHARDALQAGTPAEFFDRVSAAVPAGTRPFVAQLKELVLGGEVEAFVSSTAAT